MCLGCVKLVKDNENESNSQHCKKCYVDSKSCVKLVKDNENESNSQPTQDADLLCVEVV